MLLDFLHNACSSVEGLFLIFTIIVFGSYFIQGIASAIILQSYMKKHSLQDDTNLLQSQYMPTIALLAPAYNESAVITQSVRSLLSVRYFNIEIVIINDGSKDDTLEKLISNFDMHKHEVRKYNHLKTEEIRGIYKTSNPVSF